MPTNDLLSKGLDSDICTAHRRFLSAMESRLPAMALETKERYFAILSSLVGKLEMEDKHLREVLQEMMAETAGYIFQELGSSRP
jgi:hypothetical protein